MLDRTLAPPVQPLARVTLPPTAVQTLPSGARLHVLINEAQPVVRLQAIFRAGKWQEPQAGLAPLTARMLLEGTATRSARQIANKLASCPPTFGWVRPSPARLTSTIKLH